MREKCGVFAAKTENAPRKAYYALIALQHRGQESAGISAWRGKIRTLKGPGLVPEALEGDGIRRLKSDIAIGHVRYSTFGGAHHAQPLEVECCGRRAALAHNGTLTNYLPLRRTYEREYKFRTPVDTELLGVSFLHHLRETGDEFEAMAEVFREVKGAYSVAFLFDGKILVARDPVGFRPLSYGIGDGHYFASEDSALGMFVDEVRDVKPGEVFLVGEEVESRILARERHHGCVFEYIYFARPDSTIDGVNVYRARMRMGMELARESPADGDVVIAVPDSGRAAALGFSRESGIPYSEGLIKNRYIGRTFITPGQFYRELKVRLKLSPVREVIKGQRIVLVDDSIVRGTTMRRIVNMLRKAGAREVHVRVASPPIRHPCYMGIDIPTRHELIAAWRNVEEIRRSIGADSLAYLSVEGLVKAVGRESLCLACLTGEYPEWAFDFRV
ncbi:amidophosphoribosyltransferase [Palaeococcus ferrophilus]|uniref:amidophosphoribosyltransferase n=1 Tax=Palaeococcus ferrophilus TaxID=83868 RepID=UPI00064F1349|nr:amidophosphoribosyltransferase [Palaeococcus ferrophilus]